MRKNKFKTLNKKVKEIYKVGIINLKTGLGFLIGLIGFAIIISIILIIFLQNY